MTTRAFFLESSRQVDKIYTQSYLDRAEKQAPQAYNTLRKVAIVTTSVAIGTLLAYPAAIAVAAAAGLSFTAAYLLSAASLSVALGVIVNASNNSKHWIDLRAASIILESKERPFYGSWFNQNYAPYHSAQNPYMQHYSQAQQLPTYAPPQPSYKPTAPQQTQSVSSKFSHYTTNPYQYALVMGLNYPGTNNALQNCINDAKHIFDILLRAGFSKDNITMMLDNENAKGKKTYPTRENIIEQWKETITTYNKALAKHAEAMLYFHYSGHGTHLDDLDGDDSDGQDEALVPTDMQLLLDDVVKKILKLISPNGNVIATMDCCYSGSIYDLNNNYVYKNGEIIADEEGADESMANIVMISGCLDTQTSSDGGSIKGAGAGAMTAAYWATLEEYDYTLTWSQLLEGMNKKIKAAGVRNQYPQISSSRPIDLNSYIATREIRLHAPKPFITATA